MKKRTISLMLGILAVMMLVGVGFATWVISAGDGKTSNGTIQVDTVTDNRVYVEVSWVDGENQLRFVSNKETQTNAWLTSDNANENLSVTLKVVVKDRTGANTDANVTSEFSMSNAAFACFDNLLVGPTGLATESVESGEPVYAKATIAPDTEANHETGVYYITIQFAWGSAFSVESAAPVNPFDYFNGGDVDGNNRLAGQSVETNGDAAKLVLNQLAAISENANFSLTVSVSK